MNVISNVLYWLCTGLLIPTVIALLFFFVRALVMLGGFWNSWTVRSRARTEILRRLDDGGAAALLESPAGKAGTLVITSLRRLAAVPSTAPELDRIVGDYETSAEKELSRYRTLVRIGPMLGLMGTLIPMGPALTGLATGDVASMAGNMQVAFATTVIGLIIGGVGYALLQVRQRWAAEDLNLLVYVAETLKSNGTQG